MKWLLGKAVGALGFAGGAIPTGWIVAGALAAVGAVLGLTWKAGYNYAEMEGRAAALELKVQQQAAVIAETARQQIAVNAIQANDATRAAQAEEQNRELQRQLLETPANSAACLGVDAVERVRRFRVTPANRPAAKRPGNPG